MNSLSFLVLALSPVVEQNAGMAIEDHLPAWVVARHLWGMAVYQWVGLVAALGLSIIAGIILAAVGLRLSRHINQQRWQGELIDASRGPARVFFSLFVYAALIDLLELPPKVEHVVVGIEHPLTIISIGWLLNRLAEFIARVVSDRAVNQDDQTRRALTTKVQVLLRLLRIAIVIIGIGLILMTIQGVRQIGVSLLASAGVASVVLGLAAQKSFASLFAGLQILFTQPFSLGDTVMIDSQSGVVEEIRLTYVVVRVWDQRRIIVPITRFIEQSFQNLTKVTPEMLGTVELFVDYAAPVDAFRSEFERLVKQSSRWNKKSQSMSVADLSERTIKLQGTFSANTSDLLGDMRSEIREGWLRFLQQLEGGRYLPKLRLESSIDKPLSQ